MAESKERTGRGRSVGAFARGNYRSMPACCQRPLPHEVLNALIRGKGLKGRPLEQAVELFFSFPLEYVPTNYGLAAAAALIAEQERLTFYDAIYVALAFERSASLITANPAHQGKFKKIRVIDIADRQNSLLPSSFNG